MVCGRRYRSEFGSDAEYESHRTATMRLILGDDWQDKPLQQLVAEHPELQQLPFDQLVAEHPDLQQLPLADLIALHEQVPHSHEEQPVATAKVVNDEPAELRSSNDEPQALPAGSDQRNTEDWLRSSQIEPDKAKREPRKRPPS